MTNANTLPALMLARKIEEIGAALRQAGQIMQTPTEPDLVTVEALTARCKQIGRELAAITPNPQTRNLHGYLTEAAAVLVNLAATLTDLAVAAREHRASGNPQEIGRTAALLGALGGHVDRLTILEGKAEKAARWLQGGNKLAFWRR